MQELKNTALRILSMLLRAALCLGSVICLSQYAAAQQAAPATQPGTGEAAEAPLPDTPRLLHEVEQNQRRLEAEQRDYTYHVHTQEEELDKRGAVKKTETTEAESLTLDGIRVNRVVARNGKPLSPEEQRKESERLDKEVAKGKERRARVASKGGETDARGDEIMPLSRILELGSFSHPRRQLDNGRSVIVLDYTGDPGAKTHSTFEGIMRDVVGTLWIDEQDRILIAAQGRFLNDFKLGGGLLADVRKGTHFSFRATRVGPNVWLPAEISGEGAVRLLLFANFNGRMHVTANDYKRFHTSATIIGSNGAIDAEGRPVPGSGTPSKADAPPGTSANPVPH